ncbi:MAG: LLM class flavin-dependent oxidoreductase [Gammaproteobacteria bacterium]|nr:LLM class flavin-dependent oxidoreductase [Gammaproteobacteria bacterium]
MGYDFISTGEHAFFYGPISNGLISLAAAAGATTKIKLMSTITLVPLYPAALRSPWHRLAPLYVYP